MRKSFYIVLMSPFIFVGILCRLAFNGFRVGVAVFDHMYEIAK